MLLLSSHVSVCCFGVCFCWIGRARLFSKVGTVFQEPIYLLLLLVAWFCLNYLLHATLDTVGLLRNTSSRAGVSTSGVYIKG